MSIVLLYSPVIAGVTSNAIGRCEGMRVTKPRLLRGMALQTGASGYRVDLIAGSRMRREEECAAQIEGENGFVSHGLDITGLAMCAYYFNG